MVPIFVFNDDELFDAPMRSKRFRKLHEKRPIGEDSEMQTHRVFASHNDSVKKVDT